MAGSSAPSRQCKYNLRSKRATDKGKFAGTTDYVSFAKRAKEDINGMPVADTVSKEEIHPVPDDATQQSSTQTDMDGKHLSSTSTVGGGVIEETDEPSITQSHISPFALQDDSSCIRKEVYYYDKSKFEKLWDYKLNGSICGIAWDEDTQTWWVRKGGCLKDHRALCKFTNHGGLLLKITKDVPDYSAGLCIDKSRGHVALVEWDGGLSLFCIETGALVKKLQLPGTKGKQDVVYCPDHDQYVISDNHLRCLYFIDASSEKVNFTMTEAHFGAPFAPGTMFHSVCSDGTHTFIISDASNDVVKILNCAGEILKTIRGSPVDDDDRCLSKPLGVCCDPCNEIYIGYSGNKCIVARTKNGRDWRIAIDTNQHEPHSLSMSSDGKYFALVTTAMKSFLTVFCIKH